MTWRDVEERRDVGVLKKKPVAIQGGKGVELVGEDGTTYLDFGASYGVAVLGHGPPAVADALDPDAAFVHFTYPHRARARFFDRLADLTGLDRVFPTSSGTEAVEAALKLSVASTERSELVAVEGAFHGRSLGSLSMTYRRPFRAPFEDLLADVTFIPPDPEAVETIDEDTALFLAEPVQGEGGVHPLPPGFLQAAQDRCREVGAVFGVDEVQTGLGRTGALFAYQALDLDPDLVCLGKALGNGYPVGACVVRDPVADVPARSHGGTYNGHPRACAVADAVLATIVGDDLPARAARLGDRLLDGLQDLVGPAARQARGLGLMAALELRSHNGPVLRGLADRGVLALSAGRTVVRFLPPLVVTEDHVDRAVSALEEALDG